jgi:hypothetical protein
MWCRAEAELIFRKAKICVLRGEQPTPSLGYELYYSFFALMGLSDARVRGGAAQVPTLAWALALLPRIAGEQWLARVDSLPDAAARAALSLLDRPSIAIRRALAGFVADLNVIRPDLVTAGVLDPLERMELPAAGTALEFLRRAAQGEEWAEPLEHLRGPALIEGILEELKAGTPGWAQAAKRIQETPFDSEQLADALVALRRYFAGAPEAEFEALCEWALTDANLVDLEPSPHDFLSVGRCVLGKHSSKPVRLAMIRGLRERVIARARARMSLEEVVPPERCPTLHCALQAFEGPAPGASAASLYEAGRRLLEEHDPEGAARAFAQAVHAALARPDGSASEAGQFAANMAVALAMAAQADRDYRRVAVVNREALILAETPEVRRRLGALTQHILRYAITATYHGLFLNPPECPPDAPPGAVLGCAVHEAVRLGDNTVLDVLRGFAEWIARDCPLSAQDLRSGVERGKIAPPALETSLQMLADRRE